ncbi:uncharacterized protein LOC119189584 [Manduca sexta]|uniref:uncharacterized protein LOC119189584 n=1 Tax=Manduca sexta TaxID=7130 RepID=UPI00188DEC0A|nr:uncharacterized protein LOC119189584 [Manduca sexta]
MCGMVYYVYNFHVISLFILFRKIHSVPIDYCLQPLNKSNCNMTPTPVFSYYKPGSRCEIEFWRGCPTLNKFPDEALCSHYCIGKLFRYHEEENTIIPDKIRNYTYHIPKDPCEGELNTTHCSEQSTTVYTFHDDYCEEATWWGCETENKFDDDKTCEETCFKETSLNKNVQNWKQQLHLFHPEEVKEIDQIIDNVIESDVTTDITSTQEVTTESTTEIVTSETTSTEPVQTTEPTTSEVPTTTTITTTVETTTTVTTTEAPAGDADEVITT